MCLGIPGRVISIDTEHCDLGEVEVAGLTRRINFGILETRPSVGDWVLIQSGFAIEKIDEERARRRRNCSIVTPAAHRWMTTG
jgi:hydrogenase expression/formation protein HypC